MLSSHWLVAADFLSAILLLTRGCPGSFREREIEAIRSTKPRLLCVCATPRSHRPVCFPFFPFGILSWERVFYGCHRAQKQQEHTHGADSAFVTLLWNAPSHYDANEQTWALVNHCVFTVRTSTITSEAVEKMWRELSLGQTQTSADKHLGFLHCKTSMWCSHCILYNPISTTGTHCTFISISSTRNKSNLEAAFQTRAEELLVPEGTIKYSCLLSCSWQGPHFGVASKSDH